MNFRFGQKLSWKSQMPFDVVTFLVLYYFPFSWGGVFEHLGTFFWIPNISTFFVFKTQKNQNGLGWYCDPLGSFKLLGSFQNNCRLLTRIPCGTKTNLAMVCNSSLGMIFSTSPALQHPTLQWSFPFQNGLS